MTASKLAQIAGRVPQRVRRTVPGPLRNVLVERYCHPVTPSDGPPPMGDPDGIPPIEDREGIDNRHLDLLLGFVLAENCNCIDVVANEGRFLAQMTERAPRGRHVAWEPLPELAQRLRDRFPRGGELGVLRSAARTITEHRPLIVFEHGLGASDRDVTTPEQIHDLLTGFGMRIFDLDAAGHLSREQFVEIYNTGSRWIFFARP